MADELFPQHNKVPPILQDVVKLNGLEAMEPGESTWVVPWALDVDEFGSVSINTSMGDRNHGPGGTSSLKVVCDFDGTIIDATALRKDDIQLHFVHKPDKFIPGADRYAAKPVSGVLYPLITDKTGLEPDAVETFNEEQRALRKRFGEYYRDTYGTEYVFAHSEVGGQEPMPVIRQVLGTIATQDPERRKHKRWRKS